MSDSDRSDREADLRSRLDSVAREMRVKVLPEKWVFEDFTTLVNRGPFADGRGPSDHPIVPDREPDRYTSGAWEHPVYEFGSGCVIVREREILFKKTV